MGYNFTFTESGYIPPDGDVIFQFGQVVITHRILKGDSNNFVAIWADDTAGYDSGKFYVATQGSFCVVDGSVPSIYDCYTETMVGRAQESLDSNDIVDINKSV